MVFVSFVPFDVEKKVWASSRTPSTGIIFKIKITYEHVFPRVIE